MKTMAPFEVVNAMLCRLATVRCSTADFAGAVDVLFERSGWTPAEFFAVRRGDVIGCCSKLSSSSGEHEERTR